VNKHGLVELALYGPQETVENLYRQTKRTLARLGVDEKGAKAFVKPPRGSGLVGNFHDVVWWLDGLAAGNPDVGFAKRVHLTAKSRCRPEVLEEKD